MSWTEERIAKLKKMWKEGKSAADIAKSLAKGVTRNAVIGKAHRMGLSGRPSPIKKKTVKVAKPAAKKKPAAKTVKQKTAVVAPVIDKKKLTAKDVQPPRPMIEEAIPEDGGVALIDLTERMCKWPIGDPRNDDFTFCGQDIHIGTPYCPKHAAMAYQTSSRKSAAMAQKLAAENEIDDDEEDDDDDDNDNTLIIDDDDDDDVVTV